MNVLPDELRPFGIGEDVRGFDAQSPAMGSRIYRSSRQLSNLIDPSERFTGGHYYPHAVWSDEAEKAFDVVGGKCFRECLDGDKESGVDFKFASISIMSFCRDCASCRFSLPRDLAVGKSCGRDGAGDRLGNYLSGYFLMSRYSPAG